MDIHFLGGLIVKVVITLLIFGFVLITAAQACTGIILKTADDTTIYARTMEFGPEVVQWSLIYVPDAIAYTGSTPWGVPGAKWHTLHGYVGASPFGQSLVADGVNDTGLAVGLFYFSGYADYEKPTKDEAAKTIASHELATWLLGNCASVAEVKQKIGQIKVAAVPINALGMSYVVPAHWLVADSTGAAIVIEYIGGKLMLHDNPLGVIANSPDFDWHLTNLRNYLNLSAQDVLTAKLGEITIDQLAHGSGMLGLPGDFTSPSRFVRAAYLKSALVPAKNGEDGIKQAFHLLDQFDIPYGVSRGVGVDGKPSYEVTDWTSAINLKTRTYYIHSAGTRAIHMIDLPLISVEITDIVTIPMPTEEVFTNITPKYYK
jgi:choloylglycine hydrolase